MNIRLPNITGKTEREQLAQLKSYLNQLIPELQFAFNHIESKLSSMQKGESHSSIQNNINLH